MKNRVCFAVLFVMLSVSGVLAADSRGPTEQLKPVLDELINVLSDESLRGRQHFEERRAKIMLNIKKGFDFKEMSKRILGKTWRKLSDDERDSFTGLMTKLLENVYIGKLENYSGEAIIFDAERIKGKRAQVTTIFEGRGGNIPIHYIMRKKGDSWLVYDINIEGVSLVRNYQEQFKSILRQKKYAGLVKVIKDKNWAFEQERKLNSTEKESK